MRLGDQRLFGDCGIFGGAPSGGGSVAGRRLGSRHCARGRGGDAFGLRRASQCPADEFLVCSVKASTAVPRSTQIFGESRISGKIVSFGMAPAASFCSALSVSPMRCTYLSSHACAPIACPSTPEALPIWTPSGPTRGCKRGAKRLQMSRGLRNTKIFNAVSLRNSTGRAAGRQSIVHSKPQDRDR